MNTQKPVLVIGANGHIGSNLIENLLQQGYPIRASFRGYQDPKKHHFLLKDGVELIELNTLNPKQLQTAMKGVSGVFHMGLPHLEGTLHKDSEIVRAYSEGVQNVIEAVSQSEKTEGTKKQKRLVLISSAAAMGIQAPKEAVIHESMWNSSALTSLVQIKVEMEKRAWKWANQWDVDLITACPTFVIGPGFRRHTYATLLCDQMLRGTLPPIPEGGFHILDSRDLAEAIRTIFENPNSRGRYLVAGQYFKISELLQFVKKLDPKLKIPRFQLPAWTLHTLRPWDWCQHQLTGRPRKITGDLIREFIGTFQRVSTEKITQELKWKSRPAAETLTDTFSWIKENL